MLQQFPKFRLCFGHSGGVEGWFNTDRWSATNESYGEIVYRLCKTYENVYCDTGYLEEILSTEKRSNFVKRLKEALANTTGGPYPFGDKVMYGSDWHMIVALRSHRDYLKTFQNIFDDPGLRKYRTRFFSGNAVQFLKLWEYVQSEAPDQETADYLQWLIKQIDECEAGTR